MQATGIYDINNEIKWAVFKKWQERDLVSSSHDTSATVTGVWSRAISSPQTQIINASFLSRIAEGWQLLKDHLLESPFNPLPHSTLDIISFQKCSLLFNEDVLRFCSQSGIALECFKYHKMFIETFKNIQGITITVSQDYELPDYSKVNFVLTISDEIENVLGYEDAFKNRIRQEIDREKRRFFTYNYKLI